MSLHCYHERDQMSACPPRREVRDQRLETIRKDSGFLIIEPNILPISIFCLTYAC